MPPKALNWERGQGEGGGRKDKEESHLHSPCFRVVYHRPRRAWRRASSSHPRRSSAALPDAPQWSRSWRLCVDRGPLSGRESVSQRLIKQRNGVKYCNSPQWILLLLLRLLLLLLLLLVLPLSYLLIPCAMCLAWLTTMTMMCSAYRQQLHDAT